MRHTLRLVIPDSHGQHADEAAFSAMLGDLKRMDISEVVWLGDHLDCGGLFSRHSRSFIQELSESYEADCQAAARHLAQVLALTQNARHWYLEGNHEFRIERWAVETARHERDAKSLLERLGPEKVLGLKAKGIKYVRSSCHYQSLTVPGTIRLGKCYFTHGISHAKHAASAHLGRFGANVVFGHTHRSQSVIERTVTSDGFGAWCPGTLSQLQPLYRHTAPTSWSHGYGLQFVNQSSGRFLHFQVPIHAGKSLLMDVVDGMRK